MNMHNFVSQKKDNEANGMMFFPPMSGRSPSANR